MLTEEQRSILGWVVIYPDAWAAHAIAAFGEEVGNVMLQQKVERWRAEYDAAEDKRPRIERGEDE